MLPIDMARLAAEGVRLLGLRQLPNGVRHDPVPMRYQSF